MNKKIILILFLIIIIGCFLPIFKIEDSIARLNVLSILLIVFNTVVAFILYIKKYYKWISIPQVLSTIVFINTWVNIENTINIVDDMSVKLQYSYRIGFYFLIIGLFSILLFCIKFLLEKEEKPIIKTQYKYNKKIGTIEKREIIK